MDSRSRRCRLRLYRLATRFADTLLNSRADTRKKTSELRVSPTQHMFFCGSRYVYRHDGRCVSGGLGRLTTLQQAHRTARPTRTHRTTRPGGVDAPDTLFMFFVEHGVYTTQHQPSSLYVVSSSPRCMSFRNRHQSFRACLLFS